MRRKRPAVFIVLLLALAAAALFGRGLAARWARQAAVRHMDAGAIAAAERCLARADTLDSNGRRTLLLQAACSRHLGQSEDWARALDEAGNAGAGREALRLEERLGALRWGRVPAVDPGQVEELVKAGASRREAVTAVVHGLLANGDRTSADELSVTHVSGGDSHASYLRGVTTWWAGERDAAQRALEQALDRQPGNEPARAALARVLEERDDLVGALTHAATLAQASPRREAARVDLARVLRKLGRPDEARSVLNEAASHSDVSTAAAIELAQIEYETGRYAAARRWFERVDLDGPQVADTLRAAASAFALAGDHAHAAALFARVDEAQGLARQLSAWRQRAALDPGDRIAAGELARLNAELAARSPDSMVDDPAAPPALALYATHCAACHGADGNGAGRAARHLYPRPRNLRSGSQRLVSTLNGIPSREDVEQVLQRGMPGTAMPSFAHLSAEERRQLAQLVLEFRREGVLEQIRERLRDAGGMEDDDELRRVVAERTTPGALLRVPSIGTGDAQSIARGSGIYARSGCGQCHGADGAAAVDLLLLDEDGRPTLPRDLVHDSMKGGADGESYYKRIRLGMPGTPHPAVTTFGEAELIDLVHYCQSLNHPRKLSLTNDQRARQAARRVSDLQLHRLPREPSSSPLPGATGTP